MCAPLFVVVESDASAGVDSTETHPNREANSEQDTDTDQTIIKQGEAEI